MGMSDADTPIYVVMTHHEPNEVHIADPNKVSLTLCGRGYWYTSNKIVDGESFESGPCMRCLTVVDLCLKVGKFLSRDIDIVSDDYMRGRDQS